MSYPTPSPTSTPNMSGDNATLFGYGCLAVLLLLIFTCFLKYLQVMCCRGGPASPFHDHSDTQQARARLDQVVSYGAMDNLGIQSTVRIEIQEAGDEGPLLFQAQNPAPLSPEDKDAAEKQRRRDLMQEALVHPSSMLKPFNRFNASNT